MRRATCACGRLSVECSGEPEKISLCHCANCQKRTGSAFGIAAFYRAERVAPNGPSASFEHDAESGRPVTFYFCPSCGSSVYWEPRRKPGIVGVAVGAFADPSFPAPTQAVHADERHHWLPERLEDLRRE